MSVQSKSGPLLLLGQQSKTDWKLLDKGTQLGACLPCNECTLILTKRSVSRKSVHRTIGESHRFKFGTDFKVTGFFFSYNSSSFRNPDHLQHPGYLDVVSASSLSSSPAAQRSWELLASLAPRLVPLRPLPAPWPSLCLEYTFPNKVLSKSYVSLHIQLKDTLFHECILQFFYSFPLRDTYTCIPIVLWSYFYSITNSFACITVTCLYTLINH